MNKYTLQQAARHTKHKPAILKGAVIKSIVVAEESNISLLIIGKTAR